MKLKAFFGNQPIRLAEVKKKFSERICFLNPLILKGEKEDQFITLFQSGGIVFFNVPEEEITLWFEKLEYEPKNKETEEVVEVKIGKEIKAKESIIHVKDIEPQTIATLSMAVVRSVFLEHSENMVEEATKDFEVFITQLQQYGRLKLSTKKLIKKIASGMQIRHDTMHQIDILGTPDLPWEDPELYKLYKLLLVEYEIEARFKILHSRLDSFYQDIEFIINLIESRKTFWLELIIIILIAVEIVIFLGEILFMSTHA